MNVVAQSGILDIVTSGQLAWDGLHEKMEEPFISLGSKCIVFGNGDDDSEVMTSRQIDRHQL